MIKGIGASAGVAIGRAMVMPSWEWNLPDRMVDVGELAYEFEKLFDGIQTSKLELETIKQDISELIGEEESKIFNAHLAILEDPVFIEEVQEIMQRQYKAAEVAVKETMEKFIGMFDLLDDDYMKERAADIRDVGNRLLKHLLGDFQHTLPTQDEPYILVAKELTPSHWANLDPNQVLGVATMLGGLHSHAAIMARAMGIPLVLGLEGKLKKAVQNGDLIILDGEEGSFHLNPDEATVEKYRQRKQSLLLQEQVLQKLVDLPAVSLDGQTVGLKANISSVKELEQALQAGAEGVGLFRTEFLYMDRGSLPPEEEQFEVYRQAAQMLGEKPLVIRTLDIGGDKNINYISLPDEDNPFLGYRAIRISLDRHELFKAQLRAILRASHYGNVKIMYPFISSLQEFREANRLLEQVKRELDEKGVPFNRQIETGIMIEVPAAAMIADCLAAEADFFSIGTNDLVQYVLAVDRMNEQIAHLYDPFHPAVIRLIKQTVEAAQKHGIAVSVCGEMAGDARVLPFWLALKIKELSMSVKTLLPLKQKLLNSRSAEGEDLLAKLAQCGSSEEIQLRLEEYHITDRLVTSSNNQNLADTDADADADDSNFSGGE
ncbi:phosphoenolpyruvate--protein phosphotransferase [Paenibacillus senegalensis]|uniref:phosphoenolpyruvate--protein phosphotransferase n=1 Tax=Paenibacillus senegalensis TaxID=1465766 RepID=UPI000288F090|nr:phosphoenolpyruvate--protein phosphotransferase [Paenibacillus senegalensis]